MAIRVRSLELGFVTTLANSRLFGVLDVILPFEVTAATIPTAVIAVVSMWRFNTATVTLDVG